MKQRLVSLQVLASPATRDWQRYKYLKIHFGLFELFCVKVASDMKKPNGQLVVAFNEEEVGGASQSSLKVEPVSELCSR